MAPSRLTLVEVNERIAGLAARQHGVVAREQLRAVGVAGYRIDHRVKTGSLRVVHRGVYRVGPAVSLLQEQMAAVLVCGARPESTALPRAAIADSAAAELWQLGRRRERPMQLVVAGWNGRRVAGIHTRRVASLPAEDVAYVEGIPVTTSSRTLIDLAAVANRELEHSLARALRSGLVTHATLRSLLENRAGRPGTKLLRTLLESEAEPAFTRSEAERRLLGLVRRARLLEPEANQIVEHMEVDFLWRERSLVVEVDGFAWHGSQQAFENDRRRDAILVAAGLRVIRVTWHQIVHESEATAVRIALALSR
jgi:very-short-patch-repair endonuclease